MKKLLYFCIIFLTIGLTVSAQSCPKQIVYDFYQKKFTTNPPGDLKRDQWIQLKIDNINPYVYKIVIAERDSTASVGKPPSLLTGFFDTDKMVKVAANIVGAVSAGGAGAAGVGGPALPLANCTGQQQIMSNKIVQYAKDINDLKAQVLDKLNEYANPIRLKQLHIVNTTAPPVSALIAKSYVQDPSSVDTDFSPFFISAKTLQNTFAANYAAYRLQITGCLAAYPSNKQLKDVDDLVKQFEQEQRPVLANFAPELYEKLNTLKDGLTNLKAKNFSFTSAPMQMDQPMKNIKVTFEPVGTANAGLSSDILNIPLGYAKQPFIGFSSGFFYSTLTGNPYVVRDSVALIARNKQTRLDSAAHYYRLASENRGKGEWGVAALVHYGVSINSKQTVYLQMSAGAGLTLQNKPQPRGLLGGGFAFGSKNKVALTIGLVFGAVETISDAYNSDVGRILYAAPNGFTQSQLKGGGFFSLTYNFLTF